MQAATGRKDAKQLAIDNYEYLAWATAPLKEWDDASKGTYDEARKQIRNLDKDADQWLTPFKGHGSANKKSGSKHIHKGGMQFWLKKLKGKWVVYGGRGQDPKELIGEQATFEEPYETMWDRCEVRALQHVVCLCMQHVCTRM